MAFRDFTFPQVLTDLGLTLADDDLFPGVGPVPVDDWLADLVKEGASVASANNTEKSKSEFLIAPILLALRRGAREKIHLFSGLEWNPDPERGLNGYCDFLITRGATGLVLRTPFAAVVEAKNDIYQNGYGQCIAAMTAAMRLNERDGIPRPVYGVVSTGVNWKLLRIAGTDLRIDTEEYSIAILPLLMGVLTAMVAATE